MLNRATDISAVLTYLAVHIRHEPGRFGVVGTFKHFYSELLTSPDNIFGTVLKGDEECENVAIELRDAVAEFNSALVSFASSIGFRTFEVGTLTLDVSMRGLEVGIQTLEMVDGRHLSTTRFSFDSRTSTRSFLKILGENSAPPWWVS